MKKLKVLSFLVAAAVSAGATASLVGCGMTTINTSKISSVDELFAMKSGKSYELTCDLDLDGRIWSPKNINNFVGNGHTIKNVTITSASEGYYSGFFANVVGVSDVVFDNVNIAYSFTDSAVVAEVGFVCATAITRGNKSVNLENITVKNSTMVISTLAQYSTYVGGICGESVVSTIKNCSVENSSISVMGVKSVNEWLHIGGIVGQSRSFKENISDCKLIDSVMTCKGLSYVNMGGIVGEIKNDSSVKNLVSAGNEFTLDTTGTDCVSRFGGVIGNVESDATEVSNVVSKDNALKDNARKTYEVGGVIGRNNGIVKNSLSDGNKISATLSVNDGSQFAYAGGFCGVNNGTASRCVAQYCEITGTEFGNPWNSNYGAIKYSCGFAGRSDGSLAYCGVKDNSVVGGLDSDFSSSLNNLFNCLTDATDDEWNEVISTLNLDSELWIFENGKLKLKISEN